VADDEAATKPMETALRDGIDEAIEAGTLNPWCGICGAKRDSWAYEAGRTRFRTMAEAEAPLREQERRNALTNAIFGDGGTRTGSA
jgi:hypothetical protein